MMGRGPDAGCGIKERHCLTICRAPRGKQYTRKSGTKLSTPSINFFSQAEKLLSERCPFDAPCSPSIQSSDYLQVSVLPSTLRSLVKQQKDHNKRHKRSHSGEEKENSHKTLQLKGGIWTETEPYFKDLELEDIDTLRDSSLSFNASIAKKCLLVPDTGVGKTEKGEPCFGVGDTVDRVSTKNILAEDIKYVEDKPAECVEFEDRETNRSASQYAGNSSASTSQRALEWLLGCRSRVILTTERLSKKRKSLSSEGMENILTCTPFVRNTMCDFCCKHHCGHDSNKLLVCHICKVAVHFKCYGAEGEENESWLCGWCKRKNKNSHAVKQPCLLCPKKGGALKPAATKRGKSGSEFVHLFCALWMPEAHILDLRKMEPIIDVMKIKETRWKLVCNLCKVRSGACVRCSHGTCRIAFHPMCARDAGFKMDVWKNHGSDTVELRALCSKHSMSPNGLEALLEDSYANGSHFPNVNTVRKCPSPRKKAKMKTGPLKEKRNSEQMLDHLNEHFHSVKGFLTGRAPGSQRHCRRRVHEGNLRKSRRTGMVVGGNEANQQELSYPDKSLDSHGDLQHSLKDNSSDGGSPENVEYKTSICLQGAVSMPEPVTTYSDVTPLLPDLKGIKAISGYFLHPYTRLQLLRFCGKLAGNNNHLCDGRKFIELGKKGSLKGDFSLETAPNHENGHSMGYIGQTQVQGTERFAKAEEMGIFKACPSDELEGELIYLQHKLIVNAAKKRSITDNLISNVAKRLPEEIESSRQKRWNSVLVNKYLYELKEVKKRGRKERKHKEAQDVLAATATAATTSRISSLRKPTVNGSYHNTQFDNSLPLVPQTRNTFSRSSSLRTSSHTDLAHPVPDSCRKHTKLCDICSQAETLLQNILTCSKCKVMVHSACYNHVREPSGPWFCEFCQGIKALILSDHTYTPVAKCYVCGFTTGAFRKTTCGQWVHAYCAEWTFELTYIRGQENPVEGMETVARDLDCCCICQQRKGICTKCSFTPCQATFHPWCARSANFYMNIRIIDGRLLHKAYCKSHGSDPSIMAEIRSLQIEELKYMKQIRVELEWLRLLCERVSRREKIKRELALCSHTLLASKLELAVQSSLGHSPIFPPDSAESATTSLKANNGGYSACIDSIQRSDDVTIDSTASVRRGIKVTMDMDADQRTDDSSISQSPLAVIPAEKPHCLGDAVSPRLLPVPRSEEEEWNSKSIKFIPPTTK